LFVIIVIYAYFIDISQGSVEMHLQCGGICNNHVIAKCLLAKTWTKVKCHVFWPTLYISCTSWGIGHFQCQFLT